MTARATDKVDMTHEHVPNMIADLSARLHLTSSERFLTPSEVAEITGLHVAVVRRAIDRGDLKASKLCSRLRIRRADFNAWVEQNVVGP